MQARAQHASAQTETQLTAYVRLATTTDLCSERRQLTTAWHAQTTNVLTAN